MKMRRTGTFGIAAAAAWFVTLGLAVDVASPSSAEHNATVEYELLRRSILAPRQGARDNLQTFTQALGGAAAPAIAFSEDGSRPFIVNGETFNDFRTAANRACDDQFNDCADIANSPAKPFEVNACDRQRDECKSTTLESPVQTFGRTARLPAEANDEFEIFCDV